jgi:hypothetical protein
MVWLELEFDIKIHPIDQLKQLGESDFYTEFQMNNTEFRMNSTEF